MKKYIEPSICIEDMSSDIDIIATSGNVDNQGVFNMKTESTDEFSKKIDFSDSESIW